MKKVLIVLLACLCATSCHFFTEKNKPNKKQPVVEPDYRAETIWTLKTESHFQFTGLQQDNLLYTVEGDFSYAQGMNYHTALGKINLDTGTYIWKTETVPAAEECSPFKVQDKIGIFGHNGFLYLFSDFDGKLVATVRFSADDYIAQEYRPHATEVVSYENSIYWSYIYRKLRENQRWIAVRGIKQFDITQINYTYPATEVQVIETADLISGESYLANPLLENNILYYVTYNVGYEEKTDTSTIAALDVTTGNYLWKQKIAEVQGNTRNSLNIVDDKLYLFDSSSVCFNKNTGAILYKKVYTDWQNDIYTGPCWGTEGQTYHNGYFYYTTASHSNTAAYVGKSEDLVKNFVVIDAQSGNYVWGDLEPDSASLMTNPVVSNGKCYVWASQGLRVYDIYTKKLVGVKKDFLYTDGRQKVYYWDNKFIFFDYTSSDLTGDTSTLTAYKTD